MQNQYTQVTNTNFISRIFSSIVGVLVGVILFFGSFALLWWNEGAVDFSKIAKTAIEIKSTTQDKANNQKLVSTTGPVEANSVIGDEPYVQIGQYIVLNRKSEVYSWIEEKNSKENTNTGGSSTTTTDYTYTKKWTNTPADSSKFQYPADHANAPKSIEDKEIKADASRVGVYYFENNTVQITGLKPLTLNSANTSLPDGAELIGSEYIYIGRGSYTAPNIGDIRLSYTVLPAATKVTIFGKLEGRSIAPYFDKNNNKLYRLFVGSRDEAIVTMRSEYTTMLWIFRGVGFLLMWMGLAMVFAPISVLLDILPIFGTISRGLIGAITFAVALILSIITMMIGMIFHNIIALVVAILLTIVLMVAYIQMKKRGIPQKQEINTPSQTQMQSSVQPETQTTTIDPQLAEYINSSRKQGMTNEQILQALVKAGWSTTAAMNALNMRGQPIQ